MTAVPRGCLFVKDTQRRCSKPSAVLRWHEYLHVRPEAVSDRKDTLYTVSDFRYTVETVDMQCSNSSLTQGDVGALNPTILNGLCLGGAFVWSRMRRRRGAISKRSRIAGGSNVDRQAHGVSFSEQLSSQPHRTICVLCIQSCPERTSGHLDADHAPSARVTKAQRKQYEAERYSIQLSLAPKAHSPAARGRNRSHQPVDPRRT